MNDSDYTAIVTVVRSLLGYVTSEGDVIDVRVYPGEDGGDVVCSVRMSGEARHVIGQQGVHLLALQHLARTIVRHTAPQLPIFSVDINDYQLQRRRQLVAQAQTAAQEALRHRRPVFLEPMTAWERKVVHASVRAIDGVTTESVGNGVRKRVVVKAAADI